MLSAPHTDHNNNHRNNNGSSDYKQQQQQSSVRLLQNNDSPRSSPTDGTNNRNEASRSAGGNNNNNDTNNNSKNNSANKSCNNKTNSKCDRGVTLQRSSNCVENGRIYLKSGNRSDDQPPQQHQQVKLDTVVVSSAYKRHFGVQKWSTARSCRWNDKGGILLAMLLTSLVSFTAEVSCQVCGQPAVPLNAKVKTVSGDKGFTEAKYECDTGYELFGPNTIKCDPKRGWDREIPFCGTNVAFRKPVNQSSYTRQGPAVYANDGKPGNQNPDGQECSETQKETSPWWKVDLIIPQAVRVVRVTTRGCCGHQPLQDLEIRVGNSSIDLQRNPLCAWYPGTVDEGITKTFTCARPLIGQYVAIQLVGVEGSLSLCEVEVFTNEEFSAEKCAAPNLNADTVLGIFSRTCYEFHVTRGESFEKARQVCQSHGGDLAHNFRDAANDYILSELERRKTELKTQLVWIGAEKEPGITSRTWKWVTGDVVLKPTWGKDQPNNYNGEQNCAVLDGGRNWQWNDVGCNLDYLHFICQHDPLSCGSPDSLQNSTVTGRNYSVGSTITYSCPDDHALVGEATRTCTSEGVWSGLAPLCKYLDCGPLKPIKDGKIKMATEATTYGAQATYSCNANYTLIGIGKRKCGLTGWSGDEPQCLVDWCPEPPNIAGGKVKVSDKRSGSSAMYECQAGYVLVGEPIVTCGLGGDWSGKPPSCRFVDCGAPPRPDRGSVILVNDSTTIGAMVKYQCDEDHWLVGPSDMTCNKDGKWSGEAPICELITCETPHVPPGSYVVGYDYNVHSSIEYHCDPGHLLRGPPSLECMETGDWSGEAPFCEFIDCGPLTPIPYGTHKYLQNTTHIGSEVSFSCATTHKLSGVTKRTCLESGLWSDATPKCEEIRCSEPTLAAHSILSVTGNDRMYGRTLIRTAESGPSATQTYKIGALAKYRCERGYKIVGDPLITCEDNGQWSGHVPDCIYVECGVPPSIERGKVTLATNATYYGAATLYECNSNFKLYGVSRRLCLEDGTWSHETPACREITCDEFEFSDTVLVDFGTRLVGAEAKFTCPKGRYLIGNDTRVCRKNGLWTGKSPICKPIDCGLPLPIENGRVIVINESTIYGGSAEYHCVPNFNRIGQYLRKCLEDGKWSGEEPRCELTANEAQEGSGLGTGIAIGATIIVVLLIVIGIFFLHRNKVRPVKNTENIQAAESKEDRNASVMSYATLDGRPQTDLTNPATFNTFHRPSHNRSRNINNNLRAAENIYDQIPNEQYYDAPYEMRTNDEVYEPEPSTGNMVTINGISVR